MLRHKKQPSLLDKVGVSDIVREQICDILDIRVKEAITDPKQLGISLTTSSAPQSFITAALTNVMKELGMDTTTTTLLAGDYTVRDKFRPRDESPTKDMT